MKRSKLLLTTGLVAAGLLAFGYFYEKPKLWMVLTTDKQNNVGGTWGPLPYDLKECEVRKAERLSAINRTLETGKGENGQPVSDEVLSGIKNWNVHCVFRSERPELGSTFKG